MTDMYLYYILSLQDSVCQIMASGMNISVSLNIFSHMFHY